jgi:hypothetical protein
MAPTTVKVVPKDKVAQIVAAAAKRKEDAQMLSELFADLLPYFEVPDTRQWNIWLRRYDPDVIAESLERTAEKYENQSEMVEKAIRDGRNVPKELQEGWTLDTVLRYATGVMIKKTQESHG